MRMQLISKERLKTFIGPNGKMSGRTLARYAGVHPSFINHLTSGRRHSCEPHTAQRIADALGVPLYVLFEPQSSTQSRGIGSRYAA